MVDRHDPSRRRLLRGLAFSGAAMGLLADRLQAMSKLPEGRSIYRIQGKVLVNGRLATKETVIFAGDTIETPANGELVFAVGKDAFLLRGDSRVELTGRERVVNLLRVVSGKLLSVYGSGEKKITTPMATIGVRGTGTYVEAEQRRTYLCTCYGEVELAAASDDSVRERISTTHHESPRYVIGGPGQRPRIEAAPVINHTDAELSLIESLVGRVPLFQQDGEGGGGGSY